MANFEQQVQALYTGDAAQSRPTSLPGFLPARTTAAGHRMVPSDPLAIMNQQLAVDPSLRSAIVELRAMDKADPRVKKIHERTARAAVKGGLILHCRPGAKKIHRIWKDYERRLELNRREKLESDMRGALMEGNVPLEWVVDRDARRVAGCIRLPTETIRPLVDRSGRFRDVRAAYEQVDWGTQAALASFALWQLTMVRVRPDNYDNWASMGRPYLDATREVWRKLAMTEKDMVIRRHTRAPQRKAHVLEGATKEELAEYQQRVEADQDRIVSDYYMNRKGGVQAISGDSTLGEIADVAYLLDTFFSGAPAPKGLFGYVGDLSRDILEDLKRDYYDELDALQDTTTFAYEMGFRLELLLRGINPDDEDLSVQYAERRTETPNQRADLALKHQALGVPAPMLYRQAGLDPEEVQRTREETDEANGPYPQPNQINAPAGTPRVSVTPGNARKDESATDISTRRPSGGGVPWANKHPNRRDPQYK